MADVRKNILFVCTGNTCRSPMAEALFQLATRDRSDLSSSSAGVASWGGDVANPETQKIITSRGGDLSAFQSRGVDDQMMESATHVFCMTRGHLQTLVEAFPEFENKCYLMCEFVEINGKVGIDVPDPIGMGAAAYHSVADVFDQALPSIIAIVDQTSEVG